MRTAILIAAILISGGVGYWFGGQQPQTTVIRQTPNSSAPAVSATPSADERLTPIPPPKTIDPSDRQQINRRILEGGYPAVREIFTEQLDPSLERYAKQLVLYVYPHLLLEDPDSATLIGVTNMERHQAIMQMSFVDADVANQLVSSWFAPGEQEQVRNMIQQIDQMAAVQREAIDDPYAAFQEALIDPDRNSRFGMMQTALQMIVKEDPIEAMNLLQQVDRSQRNPMMYMVLSEWSRSDPSAAAAWALQQDGQTRRTAISVIGGDWASRDPDAASQLADQLSGRERSNYLASIAERLAHNDPDTIDTWLDTYPNEQDLRMILPRVAQQLAQNDPARAMAYLDQLPASDRQQALMSVLPQLAFTNPDLALSTVAAIPDDDEQKQRTEMMVLSMAAQNDYGSALAYANRADSIERRDQLMSAVISTIAQNDPEEAIARLDDIESEDSRKQVVRTLMYSINDDDDAFELGRSHGLEEQEIEEMRNARFGMGSSFSARTVISRSQSR